MNFSTIVLRKLHLSGASFISQIKLFRKLTMQFVTLKINAKFLLCLVFVLLQNLVRNRYRIVMAHSNQQQSIYRNSDNKCLEERRKNYAI